MNNIFASKLETAVAFMPGHEFHLQLWAAKGSGACTFSKEWAQKAHAEVHVIEAPMMDLYDLDTQLQLWNGTDLGNMVIIINNLHEANDDVIERLGRFFNPRRGYEQREGDIAFKAPPAFVLSIITFSALKAENYEFVCKAPDLMFAPGAAKLRQRREAAHEEKELRAQFWRGER